MEQQGTVDTDAIPAPDGWQDDLTGLGGPSFWDRMVVTEVARALRYRRPLTVVIAEIQGVGGLARMWGRDVGEQAVREAAQTLRRLSRTSDHCTRIGEARFGIVLPETDEIAAINFVERVREAGSAAMPRNATIEICFGWASPKLGEAPESVVRRAERRLQLEIDEAEVRVAP
jgi:diguanylate cyclase (GGDEF)-like protein